MNAFKNTELDQNLPHILNIFFTGPCNLECRYCFVKKDDQKSVPDKASLKRGIDIFFDYPGKKKVLSFNGSEPTQNFELLKEIYEYAIHQAKQKGISLDVSIITNGTLLTQDIIHDFIKYDMLVKISIDGTGATHNQNRLFKAEKAPSTFETILHTIETLDFGTLPLGASMTFTPDTYPDLIDNIKFLNTKNFSSIDFYPDLYADWTRHDLQNLKDIFSQFESYYVDLFLTNTKPFKNSLLDTFVNDIETHKMDSCHKLSFDGEFFYVCDRAFSLNSSVRQNYIIGDIHKGIDDSRRGALLDTLRRNLLEESELHCNDCLFKKYCFCPIGHSIYAKTLNENQKYAYYTTFCLIAKIYTYSFLNIKSKLKHHPKFIQRYKL